MADDNGGSNIFSDMLSFNARSARSVMEFWAGYLSAMWSFSGFGGLIASEKEKVKLQGKTGESPEGTYRIENREFRTVTVRVNVPGSVKNANGEEVSLSTVSADPDQVELGPWQSKTVKITAKIAGALNADVDYSGDIEAWTRTQCGTLVVRRVT